MMNRKIRVEKIIRTVKCVATKFKPSKREIRLLSRISFLIYSAGVVVDAVSLAASIKLPKRKNFNNFIVDLRNIIQFVR